MQVFWTRFCPLFDSWILMPFEFEMFSFVSINSDACFNRNFHRQSYQQVVELLKAVRNTRRVITTAVTEISFKRHQKTCRDL